MSVMHIETAAAAASVPHPALQLVEPPVSNNSRELEASVGAAEAAIERHDYAEALVAIRDAASPQGAPWSLVLRALFAESWALMYLGELEESVTVLDHADNLVQRSDCSDVDRAEVLYRLGCCRLKLSQVANATSLFTLALALCDGTLASCDRLRVRILEWRSRCYQRQRDFQAARSDVERALELAEAIADEHGVAHVQFQASLIAEREGQCMLALFYAEQAIDGYRRLDDRQNVARLLNNLGGLTFLLGKPDEAIRYLKDAFAASLDVGNDADAAQAISSLAQVHLRTGEYILAEEQARHALELLAGRVDFLDEIGNAQLVLGRSLLEQGRHEEADQLFRAADTTFERLASTSHRAAAWVAQGDLAMRRGDSDAAAALYRGAAESLQDFNF